MKTIYIVHRQYKSQIAFSDETVARIAAKGQGEWGSDASVYQMMLYDTCQEFNADQEEKSKKEALAKLTPYERKILGIK